ncbi:MAG: ABC transporter permease, partial [Lachnospiraceae bacterium]|nr:ABC transporter permease [Lachnospiraceae bacterium]
MKRTLILWKLELKRTIKLLPAMLLEAVLLFAVLGAVAYGASKLLYRDSPMLQITIAVVEEEENPLTDLAMQYIQGMESIADTCRFLVVSKEEGFSMLQEGKAAAVLILPGGMIDGIMNGNNVPVQVYFPENAGIESALLGELTDAGVQMLRVAQAEIYGIYDTAKNYGALEQLSVLEGDIDRFNLAFALERLALFQVKEVSATGNLSLLQYAAASGVVFFLLLLGMACYPVMQS